MVDDRQGADPAEQQQEIANMLTAMFGTPDEPFVLPETGLDLEKLQARRRPGAQRPVRQRDGAFIAATVRIATARPATAWVRRRCCSILIRAIIAKANSSSKPPSGPPSPPTIDLERIVRHGVPGTAMPAFGLLPDAQIKALVEYVKYLSMRGQTEISLINAMADLSEGDKLDTSRACWSTRSCSRSPKAGDGQREHHQPRTRSPKWNWPSRSPRVGSCSTATRPTARSATARGRWATARPTTTTTGASRWSRSAKSMASEQRRSLTADTEMDVASSAAELQARVSVRQVRAVDTTLPPRNAIPRNLRQGIYRGGRRRSTSIAGFTPASTACRCRASGRPRPAPRAR